MTEELQGALTEILNGVLTAKDFMLTELPDVVQQLLIWKLYESFILFIIFALVVCAVFIIAHMSVKKLREQRDSCPECVYAMAALINIIPSVIAVDFFTDWLQVWLAPKVYLIEYAANLAK